VLVTSTPSSTPFTRTLSLHDALPICHVHLPVVAIADATEVCERLVQAAQQLRPAEGRVVGPGAAQRPVGRTGIPVGHVEHTAERSESTRLNSSHVKISYAAFCLKKKK